MKPDFGKTLEDVYSRFNRPDYVHPDPLEFLYGYDELADREIAGLAASSLAYGRVRRILVSVGKVLDAMGGRPSDYLKSVSRNELENEFMGFKHRFATGADISGLLIGIKKTIEKFGSLGLCFNAGYSDNHDSVVPALTKFAGEISSEIDGTAYHLVPSPERGSACKRLFLFLRWMVRRDEVDPGGWDFIPPSKLVVPMDVHMHRIAFGLSLTERKSADLKAALEVTEAFRKYSPDDPVKYDFALTRFGIHGGKDVVEYFREKGLVPA